MDHDEVQKILDNFTFRQSKRKFLLKRENIFQFGKKTNDRDGIKYSWPEAVKVYFRKNLDEGSKIIVRGPIIISMKLRKDRVSFSSASEYIPKDMPDLVSEALDASESGLFLTEFDELDIHRLK